MIFIVKLSRPALIGIAVAVVAVVTVSIILVGVLPFLVGPNGGTNEDDTIEGIPDKTDIILAEGELVRFDAAHWGEGKVRLFLKSNGNYYVSFVSVTINPGPDLYVYLSKKVSFSGPSDTPGEYLDLGKLPDNSGTFEVGITENIDPSDYKSVIIWCLPFSVVFTYATLTSLK